MESMPWFYPYNPYEMIFQEHAKKAPKIKKLFKIYNKTCSRKKIRRNK